MATILLVDDDVLTMSSYLEVLRAAGHDVTFATSIHDACAAVAGRGTPFDRIIFDSVLPAGDGLFAPDFDPDTVLGGTILLRCLLASGYRAEQLLVLTNYPRCTQEHAPPVSLVLLRKRDYTPLQLVRYLAPAEEATTTP
ncbi:hypothetical protein HY632_04035 [Candidatus Uhrbacteria bacterium]|nr:hypothetical protein [Candidatus Uhrbacteria bacterium]